MRNNGSLNLRKDFCQPRAEKHIIDRTKAVILQGKPPNVIFISFVVKEMMVISLPCFKSLLPLPLFLIMHLEPLNISETDIFISGGWNLCLFHSKPTPILIQKEFCAFSRRDMDKFV